MKKRPDDDRPLADENVTLASCPFCGSGGDAEPDKWFRIFRDGRSAYQVVCVDCGARGPSIPTVHTKKDGVVSVCVKAWNLRGDYWGNQEWAQVTRKR